jgi:hypothetical protein
MSSLVLAFSSSKIQFGLMQAKHLQTTPVIVTQWKLQVAKQKHLNEIEN